MKACENEAALSEYRQLRGLRDLERAQAAEGREPSALELLDEVEILQNRLEIALTDSWRRPEADVDLKLQVGALKCG